MAASEVLRGIDRGVVAVDVDAKCFAKHGDADLKADACEKAEENRLRQEIREEAKLE